LLTGEARTSTVTCVGRVEVAKIDQYAFKLLLAPVTDTLTRRIAECRQRDQLVGELHRDLCSLPQEILDRASKQRIVLANQNPNLLFSDLEVIGFLGKGGYGYVELVKHKKTGATYALKTLYRAHVVRTRSQANVLNEKNIDIDGFTLYYSFICNLQDKTLLFLLEHVLGGNCLHYSEIGVSLQKKLHGFMPHLLSWHWKRFITMVLSTVI
jgi:serine/threonine protein kinase